MFVQVILTLITSVSHFIVVYDILWFALSVGKKSFKFSGERRKHENLSFFKKGRIPELMINLACLGSTCFK